MEGPTPGQRVVSSQFVVDFPVSQVDQKRIECPAHHVMLGCGSAGELC